MPGRIDGAAVEAYLLARFVSIAMVAAISVGPVGRLINPMAA